MVDLNSFLQNPAMQKSMEALSKDNNDIVCSVTSSCETVELSIKGDLTIQNLKINRKDQDMSDESLSAILVTTFEECLKKVKAKEMESCQKMLSAMPSLMGNLGNNNT